jgi:rhamnosyltransferase
MNKMIIPLQMLGQSGCRLSFPEATVYVDPYLSNSVEELDAPDLVRQVPIFIDPCNVIDADIVLITHEHMDHCDPQTLPILAKASPNAVFYGPPPVIARLREWGIEEGRIKLITEDWYDAGLGLRFCAIPAAHPEISRDQNGYLERVGYLIEFIDQKIYIAGDTFATQEIIDSLVDKGPINTAFLPVNEHNFFRGRRGIIGNMSVREAFQFAEEIGAKKVVAVHWDMFSINAVNPDEIKYIHQKLNPNFSLLINPSSLSLNSPLFSIVIRTLNEERHLKELLSSIATQDLSGDHYEVIIVDSGSTDNTLSIAREFNCHIKHIAREEFSFGRSLNIGCESANGEFIVIVSGHCVPLNKDWLRTLCQPLIEGIAQYAYGRQYAGHNSNYSESRVFDKHFPEQSKIPQEGFYCNNANSALCRQTWEEFRFDESLTGLEDMELAQRVTKQGGKIAYAADAGVYHYHYENWKQVRRRFERESIALRHIMPQIHLNLLDTIRYAINSILTDWRAAKNSSQSAKFLDLVRYRWNQYWGSWKGNHEHRELSHKEKEEYFFPDKLAK